MADVKGLAKRAKPDGKGLRVAIIKTQWNEKIIDALVSGCEKELKALHVSNIEILEVPGSYELPFACQKRILKGNIDAVIAIGCLIKGSTMHFEYICESVSVINVLILYFFL